MWRGTLGPQNLKVSGQKIVCVYVAQLLFYVSDPKGDKWNNVMDHKLSKLVNPGVMETFRHWSGRQSMRSALSRGSSSLTEPFLLHGLPPQKNFVLHLLVSVRDKQANYANTTLTKLAMQLGCFELQRSTSLINL